MNNTEDVLRTIYDDVKEITPSVFGIKHKDCFGVAIDKLGVVMEPRFKHAILREHYAIFASADMDYIRPSDTTVRDTTQYIVFFSKPNEVVEVTNLKHIIEHSGIEYKMLEVGGSSDGEKWKLYNAVTGEILAEYDENLDYSFRNQQNYIVLGYEEKDPLSGTSVMMGVTQDMKKGTVESLLRNKYGNVEFVGRTKKMVVTDRNGKKIKFNRFGQSY